MKASSIHGVVDLVDEGSPERRESEKDVRLLLHRARKPEQLAHYPLAQALCSALGFSDASAAVRRVVEETFPGDSGDDAVLRNLVVKCDIEGSLTLSEACSQFAYSRRHFQRYRAQAIGAIARYIKRLLDPSFTDGPILHPLEGLADIVADRDPAAATHIYDLVRNPIQAKGELQQLHARVRSGDEVGERDLLRFGKIPEPLGLAIAAQSKELAGNASEVTELLSRLHYSAARAKTAFDTATCFELEWLRFLQAAHRCDTPALESSAHALERLSTDKPSLRARTLIASGTAAVHQGHLREAAEKIRLCALISYQERSAGRLALATLLQSQVEFLRGDAATAENLAKGASLALDEHDVAAFDCHYMIARARLVTGEAWSPPNLSKRPRTAWHRIALELASARHRLAQGDVEAARSLSLAGYQIAEQLRYTGLCAYAAATLMGCFMRLADPDAAQRWRIVAFSEFAHTQDHLLGFDLFTLPGVAQGEGASLPLAEGMLHTLYERVTIIVPQLMSDTAEQQRAVRDLISVLARYAMAPSYDIASLDPSIASLNAANSAFAHYFEKTSAMIETMLALNLSVLLPNSQRQHLRDRLTSAMHYLESRVSPGEKRLFLVG